MIWKMRMIAKVATAEISRSMMIFLNDFFQLMLINYCLLLIVQNPGDIRNHIVKVTGSQYDEDIEVTGLYEW